MPEETLWTLIGEIRAAHTETAGSCATCWMEWPCPTLQIVFRIEKLFRDLEKSVWK